MDDVMVRTRYPRRIQGRRHRKIVRQKSGLPLIISRQVIVSLVILLAAGIVKSINAPVTNYVSDKIQYILKQDIEIKSIYEYFNSAIANIKNSISPSKEEDTETASADLKASAEEKNTSVLAASTEAEALNAGMTAPVKGVLTSPFGERIDPVTGVLKLHEGIDIAAGQGDNITAAMDGTVTETGSSPSYGNYIKIKHSGGLETVYAHCSVLYAVKGSAVKQGEVIAAVGESGASVGVHLHFEVRKDGKPVNPLDYISIPQQ